ncbi:MAG: hypothetical protein ABIE74_03455 [Pseudomonadota bacterium]
MAFLSTRISPSVIQRMREVAPPEMSAHLLSLSMTKLSNALLSSGKPLKATLYGTCLENAGCGTSCDSILLNTPDRVFHDLNCLLQGIKDSKIRECDIRTLTEGVSIADISGDYIPQALVFQTFGALTLFAFDELIGSYLAKEMSSMARMFEQIATAEDYNFSNDVLMQHLKKIGNIQFLFHEIQNCDRNSLAFRTHIVGAHLVSLTIQLFHPEPFLFKTALLDKLEYISLEDAVVHVTDILEEVHRKIPAKIVGVRGFHSIKEALIMGLKKQMKNIKKDLTPDEKRIFDPNQVRMHVDEYGRIFFQINGFGGYGSKIILEVQHKKNGEHPFLDLRFHPFPSTLTRLSRPCDLEQMESYRNGNSRSMAIKTGIFSRYVSTFNFNIKPKDVTEALDNYTKRFRQSKGIKPFIIQFKWNTPSSNDQHGISLPANVFLAGQQKPVLGEFLIKRDKDGKEHCLFIDSEELAATAKSDILEIEVDSMIYDNTPLIQLLKKALYPMGITEESEIEESIYLFFRTIHKYLEERIDMTNRNIGEFQYKTSYQDDQTTIQIFDNGNIVLKIDICINDEEIILTPLDL